MNTIEKVTLCSDGKYRWVYSLSLYKNPVILFTVLKIIGWVTAGLWLFMVIITCFGHRVWESICNITVGFGLFAVFMLALCVVGYGMFALFVGGKYHVVFEMDEKGVTHKQMPYNTQKAQLIGKISALTGAVKGNPTMVGRGLLIKSKTEQHTSFKKVNSVEVMRRHNVIKVNATLSYNQVYVRDEDFELVLDYITSRIPTTATVK